MPLPGFVSPPPALAPSPPLPPPGGSGGSAIPPAGALGGLGGSGGLGGLGGDNAAVARTGVFEIGSRWGFSLTPITLTRQLASTATDCPWVTDTSDDAALLAGQGIKPMDPSMTSTRVSPPSSTRMTRLVPRTVIEATGVLSLRLLCFASVPEAYRKTPAPKSSAPDSVPDSGSKMNSSSVTFEPAPTCRVVP